MLTQTVEYALRAVTTLAGCEGASATTEGLAERTKVPVAYLAKILQGLAKAGLIRTQRGVGGGVSLAKPPATLSVLEVVNAVEPVRRYKECPLGLHGTALCPLHSRLDAALASLEAAFAATTLADVLADPNPNKPLCPVPADVHPNGAPGATVQVPLGVKGRK
jgi:Rrf2 family protein